MEHRLEDSDGEEELPRKRFEPDFEGDCNIDADNWEPTEKEYEQYERILWQAEFRKLLEMDQTDEIYECLENQPLPVADVLDNLATLSTPTTADSSAEIPPQCPSPPLSSSSSAEGGMEEDDTDDFESEYRYPFDDPGYPLPLEVEPLKETLYEKSMRIFGHKAFKVKHPLLIPEIIEQVMCYLDYHHDRETLENCKQVCYRWSQAVQKRLDEVDSEESFKLSAIFSDMTLENQLKSCPKNCHIFNIKLPTSPENAPPGVETVFKNIGPQVKELDVCFNQTSEEVQKPVAGNQPLEEPNQNSNENREGENFNQNENSNSNSNSNIEFPATPPSTPQSSKYNYIGDVLEQYCPHIEKLKLFLGDTKNCPDSIFTQEMPHFLPLKHIETEDFSGEGKTHIFEELIQASPFLEHLTFSHEDTKIIVKMLSIIASQSPNRLRHLTSLESYHFEVGDEFITFALKQKWNLVNLKIAFKKEVSISRIRALLNHLRETLKNLEILYKGQEYDPSLPIEDNWVVPISMKKLRRFEASPNLFSNAARFLVNALQLPNLKSLKFNSSISWSENYFESMWKRNRIHRSQYAMEDPSLEVFEIPCSCLDASIFLQVPNPFRNLKELVLDSPSIKVLQSVFLAEINLERLKVFELYSLDHYTWDDIMTGYFKDLEGRPLIWDEILTGEKKPEYTLMYPMRAEPLMEAVPSIRNLSKLKFLLLDFKSSTEKISDFFIYHGLMHLTELQHLDINRHNFTDDAVNDLRGRLANFCYLELGSDSDLENEDEESVYT